MRTLYFSLLITLLVLIQSKGSIGGDAETSGTLATLEASTTTIGQIGETLKSYAELDAAGKANFKAPILFTLFSQFGSTFTPIWGIITLAIGSLNGARHTQIMNKLESIGQDISIIYHKIDSQALDLKHAMESIRHENLLPELISASEKYEKYVSGSYPDHYAGLLADNFKNDDIQTNIIALRNSIGNYVSTSMYNHGNCNKLTDERVWLTALLANSALALGIGCAEFARQNKYNETKTHDICDNLDSYKTILEIEEIMIKKIKECNTITFANLYTKRWIESQIRRTDIDGTSKKISSMLTEKFPQFGHTVVVYPPLEGFEKHATNFGVTVFRHKEMNIAVHILSKNEKRCLALALGSVPVQIPLPKEFEWLNAIDLYNKMKPSKLVQNKGVLVFRARKNSYSISGSPVPGKIWCMLRLNNPDPIRRFPTTFVYV